jgi:beta-1,4-mannosyl-glycoprotein beta-1,4-N-acetylglucosaminyltransferase
MIYDTFSFFNELELLDIRLHELDSVVDRFVLLEASKTYSGLDKPMYFDENRQLFSNYLDKIIYIPLIEFPESFPTDDTGNWLRENYQRNFIMTGLKECKDDDIIIVSDLDEIPRNTIFGRCNNFKDVGENFYTIHQLSFYYYFNTYFTNFIWRGSTISNYRVLSSQNPQYFRNKRRRGIQIENGGWHFSYMGGINKIQYKITSFAHSEFDNDQFNNKEYLNKCVSELRCYHTRDQRHKKMIVGDVNDKGFLPKYVTENLDKFKTFIR